MGGPVKAVKVAPSLLAADFTKLAEEIFEVEQAGADLLHLDVMDGHFVPNLTFGPILCRAVAKITRLPLDVHLMVVDPDRLLEPFAEAGASRLAVQVEAVTHLHRTLTRIRGLHMSPGVAINPLTPLAAVEEALRFCDFVVLMTVNPGFGGQTLIPEMVDKLARLARLRQFLGGSVELVVDGGVNLDNASKLVENGADVLVAGTAVFAAPDRGKAVRTLKGET